MVERCDGCEQLCEHTANTHLYATEWNTDKRTLISMEPRRNIKPVFADSADNVVASEYTCSHTTEGLC
jgi:hypothetical protein